MVNMEPAGFFSSSRGLQQGDPLSPFLFIMIMEALRVVSFKDSMFQGGQPVKQSCWCHIFCLWILVFCEAKRAQLGYLCLVLLFFQALSELKINILKCRILLVGVVGLVGDMDFGCKTAYLPTIYLGLPLELSLRVYLCGIR